MTTIGILALQGDFAEHAAMLRRLDAPTRQVRTAEDLKGLDGLIVPGGESTTFCKLMEDFSLYEPLSAVVSSGVPVWGTCAGMIVLARHASDLGYPTLEAIDIEVARNAYGRQVDSFEADLEVPAIGDPPFHGVFIRAPVVLSVGEDVEVLASATDGSSPASPVAVRQDSVIATSFHPELTDDDRLHSYFLNVVRLSDASGVAK